MISFFWIFLEGNTMHVAFQFQHTVNKNIERLLFSLFKYTRDLVSILCITYKYIFQISKILFFDLNAVN